MLGPLWDFVASTWVADIIDAIGSVVRLIPYTLLFLLGFLIVQCLMACHASVDMGNGPAARALVHGAFLDGLGLGWSLGVPTVLVASKWLARATLGRRE